MQSLNDATIGGTYTIQWMMCDPHTMEVIDNNELKEGMTVRVVGEFYGNVILGVGDKRLAIGKEAAKDIKVSSFT
jgi:ferrous iron transport protein A